MRGFTARGVEREQLRAGGGPDAPAVVGDAVDWFGTGDRAVLAHDFGRTGRRLGHVLICAAGHHFLLAVRRGSAPPGQSTQAAALR
ncbi:MAG: hypothetical protein ABIU95_06660 [Burkholderiales bacterium]